MRDCKSIEEVRECIDSLDNQIVKLLSERSRFVEQAAKFKKDAEDVKAPQRVEAVIEKVRKLANENNVNPNTIEEIYRTMISCFIQHEMVQHAKINT
ncbi:chorismate mutase [Lysinibacillus macroides]|uniref:Chorismate mutase n=1 Tax=Lysinibacillus macroides TaxID=33935 RepID=A0A0M9DMZ9_9BACI|nr:chorismate mutase [Lysinibacillus macroides]KOY84209.1 chorismate mutase [Lysinibacillus macroides]QPR66988.1 chorismate mutase [Lysinibacillus macroides]